MPNTLVPAAAEGLPRISRRLFMRGTVAASAAAAAIAAPAVIEAAATPSVDLTAIPTETVEKIKAWQHAHRASVQTHKAYSESLRAKPIDKAECNRCWEANLVAHRAVGPAREAMIFALWRI
ncbi:hypothetical protein [Mesorhizobium sp. DCY119]|uniref:hypothetical protein n=1 Tax=Mesorhizobium sp. DCY119 TaxID=2108445 RepID=UPI000E715499|nr:hypothetical protein [Mesorhizobium sp. DCY119]RJG46647.1 hypothetical protein D3Y55_21920 [Mesorhizobium sp. DCY119]